MLDQNNLLAERTFRDADLNVIPYDGSGISWRVSAYVVVLDSEDVLLIKDKNEEYYDIVGGGIEFGEDLEQAIARECLEEAGAVVKIGGLLQVKVDWFYHRQHKKYYQSLQLYYLATLVTELAAPQEKSVAWRGFVPIGELEKKYPVQPIIPQVVKKALKLNKRLVPNPRSLT